MLNKFIMEDHVKAALIEDIGYGDITTENLAEEFKYQKCRRALWYRSF